MSKAGSSSRRMPGKAQAAGEEIGALAGAAEGGICRGTGAEMAGSWQLLRLVRVMLIAFGLHLSRYDSHPVL